MVKYEKRCADCGKPCIHEACRNYKVPIWVCDECGDEGVDLFDYDNRELCKYCLLETVPKIHHE